MGFDGHRPRAGRTIVVGALLTMVAMAVPVVFASPATASSSTDLGITLANKADAVPGKRVSYQIVVHNAGPATARRVQIDFYTSTQLNSVQYAISTAAAGGHCYRSPKETACIFGTLKAGDTQHVTISGVLPAKMAKGTTVTNKVTLASDTSLINKTNDVATDNYKIGIPRAAAAPVAASPSASPVTKLQKITTAASTAINFSHKALLVSALALGAAALWFSIGLTLRHRSRRKRGAALDSE